jgi:hypothetical protein
MYCPVSLVGLRRGPGCYFPLVDYPKTQEKLSDVEEINLHPQVLNINQALSAHLLSTRLA